MSKEISEKAEVNQGAKIGKNVKIDSFSFIDNNVIIGDDRWIGTNVTIYQGARIGKNCKIFPGAVISAIPQDLKYQGEDTIVEIGDNTTIRECVTINKGTNSKGVTKVGDNCLIMAYVHISHDSSIGNHCILSNSVQVGGEVEIDDWAIIGGMTAVHQFCKVGQHAMVSGMSGVLSDIPPFLKVAGFPTLYKGINYVGLKRRNFLPETIENIHNIYRVIFQKGLNTSQALEHIQNSFFDSVEKKNIMLFVKNSKRGIIKTNKRKMITPGSSKASWQFLPSKL